MNKAFKIPTTIYQLLKKLRLRTYIALGLIAVMLPIAFLTLYHPGESEAAWWNESWQYRKRIPITAHAAEETNVYISITNYNASDTTRYQADCGDMRFTKQNGELLPYYVANCGVATTIHVNFDVFPAGAQDIYVYYGNPSAENGFSNSDFSTEATNYTLGTIASEEVTPGPIAYWKFDEGTGTTAEDSTINNNDGTISGATWQTEDQCVSEKCLYFDGASGVDITGFTSTSQTYTFSVWVRTNAPDDNLNYLFDSATGRLIFGWAQDTPGEIAFYDISWKGFGQNPNDGEWHHLALVLNDNTSEGTLYIDGSQFGSTLTYSGRNIGGATKLANHNTATNAGFTGFMDEFKIYPYARTPEQIKADYNQGAAVLGMSDQSFLSDGLVGYWKMDEASGTSAADASGNGNNGTLTNAQETGTSDASGNTTTTLVDTDGASLSTTDDAYNGMILRFTAACGSITSGTERVISDYTGATKTFTVGTALAASPNSCAYEVRHQVGGKFGNGMEFDGSDDYTSIATTGMSATEGSIGVWFNHGDNATVTEFLIAHRNGLNNRIYLGINSSNVLLAYIGADTIIDTNTTLTNGEWYNSVLIWNNNTYQIYLNGTLVKSGTYSDLSSLTSTMCIGSYGGTGCAGTNNFFDGKLDEVRIYNRALSPAEVAALYNWAPGPENYLNMDEGAGTTLNDSSGNSRNGALNNGTWNTGKYGKGVNLDGTGDYVEINDY